MPESQDEWWSYACACRDHAACSRIAWRPDIACECKCHDVQVTRPEKCGAEAWSVLVGEVFCHEPAGHDGDHRDDAAGTWGRGADD